MKKSYKKSLSALEEAWGVTLEDTQIRFIGGDGTGGTGGSGDDGTEGDPPSNPPPPPPNT